MIKATMGFHPVEFHLMFRRRYYPTGQLFDINHAAPHIFGHDRARRPGHDFLESLHDVLILTSFIGNLCRS